MNNAAIIRNLPARADKKAELKATKRALAADIRKVERLEEVVDVLDQVAEVINGVAVVRYRTMLVALGDDINRRAEVYPNAHNNGKTFGVRTFDDGYNGERFHGYNFTKAEADQMAETWVTKGIRPDR